MNLFLALLFGICVGASLGKLGGQAIADWWIRRPYRCDHEPVLDGDLADVENRSFTCVKCGRTWRVLR